MFGSGGGGNWCFLPRVDVFTGGGGEGIFGGEILPAIEYFLLSIWSV